MTIQDRDIEASPADRHTMVGVLAGMGPDVAVAFMQRVIDATPAEDDIDHVHLLVDNNLKVPSRIKALIDGDSENPGPRLPPWRGDSKRPASTSWSCFATLRIITDRMPKTP